MKTEVCVRPKDENRMQPPTECPFGDGFTGRTLHEADAVHRGWGVEWTAPYWSVLLLCTLPGMITAPESRVRERSPQVGRDRV